MVPAPTECYSLMSQYGMLDNIKAHSLVVSRIAEFLGSELMKSFDLDLGLVVSGALLHDIGKTACLHNGQNHALLGANICTTHGYAEVAPLVAQHVILSDDTPVRPDEMQVVYYADKRVNHDQIVSLESRLDYILVRYGCNDPRRIKAIQRNFTRCYAIEEAIFSYLQQKPEDLQDLLPQQSDFERKMA